MEERASFLLTPDYQVQVDKTTIDKFDIARWMSLPVKSGEQAISTTHGLVKIPEILLLSEFNKIPDRKVVFCRRNLWRRDRSRCQYCGKVPAPDEMTIDHIVPRAAGGLSVFENCVLACMQCNLKKGSRDLESAGMSLRRMKRLPNGEWTAIFYDKPKIPIWNPLYALRRKNFPKSWSTFLKNFDETLYWEVGLD